MRLMIMRTGVLVVLMTICGCREKMANDPEAKSKATPASMPPPSREMVTIPSGTFRGADMWCFEGTSNIKHPEDPPKQPRDNASLQLPAFAIDKAVVHCGEIERCFEAGKCGPNAMGAEPFRCMHGIAVTTLETAAQFCAWRGMQVASWFQWQRAVRGVDGRIYPRGMTWDDSYDRDPHIPGRGRFYVSTEGVEYFLTRGVKDVLVTTEFTRDVDCARKMNPEYGDARGPVIISLDYDQLNAVWVWPYRDRHTTSQFRCAQVRVD